MRLQWDNTNNITACAKLKLIFVQYMKTYLHSNYPIFAFDFHILKSDLFTSRCPSVVRVSQHSPLLVYIDFVHIPPRKWPNKTTLLPVTQNTPNISSLFISRRRRRLAWFTKRTFGSAISTHTRHQFVGGGRGAWKIVLRQRAL